MFYFRITDKESDAWERHQEYQAQRQAAFDQVRELIEELELDTDQLNVHLGSVTSFTYSEGDHVPEGMRARDGKLLPDERYNAGKEVNRRMRAITFPTQNDYMEMMFGARGEEFINGRHYTGCGLVTSRHLLMIQVRPGVFADARRKDGFGIPHGCEKIPASVYHRHHEELFDNDKIKN